MQLQRFSGLTFSGLPGRNLPPTVSSLAEVPGDWAKKVAAPIYTAWVIADEQNDGRPLPLTIVPSATANRAELITLLREQGGRINQPSTPQAAIPGTISCTLSLLNLPTVAQLDAVESIR